MALDDNSSRFLRAALGNGRVVLFTGAGFRERRRTYEVTQYL